MAERAVWDVGDHDGFMACYDATRHEVYRYSSRLTGDRQHAEDLVQDVYVETLRRARGGGLEPIGAGWLCRAARHRFVDRLRRVEREERRLRLVPSMTADDTDGDVTGAALLAELTPRERAAVVLHHVDGLGIAEVADALGTTMRATESLLARARARVRRLHEQEVRDA